MRRGRICQTNSQTADSNQPTLCSLATGHPPEVEHIQAIWSERERRKRAGRPPGSTWLPPRVDLAAITDAISEELRQFASATRFRSEQLGTLKPRWLAGSEARLFQKAGLLLVANAYLAATPPWRADPCADAAAFPQFLAMMLVTVTDLPASAGPPSTGATIMNSIHSSAIPRGFGFRPGRMGGLAAVGGRGQGKRQGAPFKLGACDWSIGNTQKPEAFAVARKSAWTASRSASVSRAARQRPPRPVGPRQVSGSLPDHGPGDLVAGDGHAEQHSLRLRPAHRTVGREHRRGAAQAGGETLPAGVLRQRRHQGRPGEAGRSHPATEKNRPASRESRRRAGHRKLDERQRSPADPGRRRLASRSKSIPTSAT